MEFQKQKYHAGSRVILMTVKYKLEFNSDFLLFFLQRICMHLHLTYSKTGPFEIEETQNAAFSLFVLSLYQILKRYTIPDTPLIENRHVQFLRQTESTI